MVKAMETIIESLGLPKEPDETRIFHRLPIKRLVY